MDRFIACTISNSVTKKLVLVLAVACTVALWAFLDHFNGTVSQQRPAPVASDHDDSKPSPHQPLNVIDSNFDHGNLELQPLAFNPWPSSVADEPKTQRDDDADKFPWCVPETVTKKATWFYDRSTSNGLFFSRAGKTGSSTVVGAQLRIARNVVSRKRWQQQPSEMPVVVDSDNSSSPSDGRKDLPRSSCKIRMRQIPPFDLGYQNRDRKKSFLWAMLREPTKRAISHFFFEKVSRQRIEPTARNFQSFLRIFRNGYYLKLFSLRALNETSPKEAAQGILQDYDFIGLTERMDESLVVLQMLLGLSIADILYFSANKSGGYDVGGGFNHTCGYIQPSVVTDSMRSVLASDEWQDSVKWDDALYLAANASLDLTIQRLGRSQFEEGLAKFREALLAAKKNCSVEKRFPCDKVGVPPLPDSETGCLYRDSGCGQECLDRVATQLDLWKE